MAASSAAALTGLMFVVITLVSGEERLRRTPNALGAFSTPTVVHFSASLFVSAILVAPWRGLVQPAFLLGLAGLCGVVYLLRAMHLTRRLKAYRADLEDWLWYSILPFVAYGALLAGAIMLPRAAADALFAIAGSVGLLILIGIRNAWDIVTFIATQGEEEPPASS